MLHSLLVDILFDNVNGCASATTGKITGTP